jgi:hypothetical protein
MKFQRLWTKSKIEGFRPNASSADPPQARQRKPNFETAQISPQNCRQSLLAIAGLNQADQ